MNHHIRLCAFADEASASCEGQIAALRDNGMSLLEIRGVDGTNISALPVDRARAYKAMLDEAGIAVWSIGSPAGKSRITEDFSKEQMQFEHLLTMAEIFGARCIRLFSFYGTDGDEKWLPEVARRLQGFVDMAAGSGVILCHENEKGIYGDVAVRCKQIHEAVPGVRAVFDPANFIQSGQDVPAAWELLAPYVYYGHIKDALADGRVVPPGDGIGALRSYIPQFAAQGGEVLTLEPHLSAFVGLKGLEEEGARSDVGSVISFRDSREAFDYAASRLRAIVAEL